jgi:hypothetical protein
MSKIYKCSNCNLEFELVKNWTDEDAIKEKEKNFPGITLEECDIVCDDCYQKLRDLPK